MSRLLNYFEKHLVTPLRQLDADEYGMLVEHLSAFLVPMESLQHESQLMKQQIGAEFGDFYSFVVGSVLGVSGFTVDVAAQKRLLPRLAEFIRERGSRRGIEILVECFFDTTKFSIDEQTHPFSPLRLSMPKPDERLSSDMEGPLSITIVFERARESFDEKVISDFRSILEHELAPNTTVYLLFNEEAVISCVTSDYGCLGEGRLQ